MENENQNGGGETCAVCSQHVTTEDKDTHARTHEEKEVGNEQGGTSMPGEGPTICTTAATLGGETPDTPQVPPVEPQAPAEEPAVPPVAPQAPAEEPAVPPTPPATEGDAPTQAPPSTPNV